MILDGFVAPLDDCVVKFSFYDTLDLQDVLASVRGVWVDSGLGCDERFEEVC